MTSNSSPTYQQRSLCRVFSHNNVRYCFTIVCFPLAWDLLSLQSVYPAENCSSLIRSGRPLGCRIVSHRSSWSWQMQEWQKCPLWKVSQAVHTDTAARTHLIQSALTNQCWCWPRCKPGPLGTRTKWDMDSPLSLLSFWKTIRLSNCTSPCWQYFYLQPFSSNLTLLYFPSHCFNNSKIVKIVFLFLISCVLETNWEAVFKEIFNFA